MSSKNLIHKLPGSGTSPCDVGERQLNRGARRTDKLDTRASHKSNHVELLRSLPSTGQPAEGEANGRGKIDSSEFSRHYSAMKFPKINLHTTEIPSFAASFILRFGKEK